MAASIQSGIPSQLVGTNIDAPGPTGPLQGTLLSPGKQEVPVVLIVPGSGPTDRDGNGPNGLRASTYRLLADGLLSRGIASVRIDKRGMFGSASAIPDADDVTLEDYAADVHSWVTAIRKHTGVSCVWVLGHSEGGLVALVAAQGTADICGLILLSTAGRPLGRVLRDQLRSTSANAPILNNAMAVLDALEAGQTVDATKIDRRLMPLFRPQVQRFLMSELALDPATLLANYTNPVLIIQGYAIFKLAPRTRNGSSRHTPKPNSCWSPTQITSSSSSTRQTEKKTSPRTRIQTCLWRTMSPRRFQRSCTAER
ncbi:Hydrolase, alpha/beta fold family functionally coupled to Phosphoribulokinase [Caballeronia sordidicola]|uniref:Hydrolase, alpha/beta fold family functionally coupled to Phosphoribulokinase n=1 Tax=Caballeronia sordidicola TaxID=196367 RepID=A0A242MAL4_CABSO|nr:Hydrolase, alpha/beta fold family functionally coupled to Phosphoribulokinase [Caballeronia sordidicola]